jgi:hypothetical protein
LNFTAEAAENAEAQQRFSLFQFRPAQFLGVLGVLGG